MPLSVASELGLDCLSMPQDARRIWFGHTHLILFSLYLLKLFNFTGIS